MIACAMANRANRIAFALVRDNEPYDRPGGTGRPDQLFTTLVGSARIKGTKDPDQTPRQLWQTSVIPLLAWRPGPSPCGSPNEAR